MSKKHISNNMDYASVNDDYIVHISRAALTGRRQDIQLLIRRLAREHRGSRPDLSTRLLDLLRQSPSTSSPLRGASAPPLPVDTDSRLHLVRLEDPPVLDSEPILAAEIGSALRQLVAEHRSGDRLAAAGLDPARTALFSGPPGVGKTLAARWVARELAKPLVILDLAAVMSSFLGRTGNNVRAVLDYTKEVDCVLLLDELDAVAKRRDDATEVGELKRLVTVLLQEIDDWPTSRLLLAATNHGDLLDPAVWRRFDVVVNFTMPDSEGIRQAVKQYTDDLPGKDRWVDILSLIFAGESFSDIRRTIMAARRSSVVHDVPIEVELESIVKCRTTALGTQARIALAGALVQNGIASRRRAQQLTGVSRDTIRKHEAKSA